MSTGELGDHEGPLVGHVAGVIGGWEGGRQLSGALHPGAADFELGRDRCLFDKRAERRGARAAGPREVSRGGKCPGSGGHMESHFAVGPRDRLSVGVRAARAGAIHPGPQTWGRRGRGGGILFCSLLLADDLTDWHLDSAGEGGHLHRDRDLAANDHLATLGQKSRFGMQRQRGAIEKGEAA